MNKILVCYLFTCFDKHESISNFIKYYKKYTSGVSHNLLICFKMLKENDIFTIKNLIKNIDYIEFIDPNKFNDYDFGSYKRISELNKDKLILFLNSHSYPVCNDWLSKLTNNCDDHSLIGTSASYESILDSIKLKKKTKIISYFLKKFKFKKKFDSFPNPHIRTSSFLIKGQTFLDFIKDREIYNKTDAWEIESGRSSLTNYFKDKNYKIFVVNSDGKRFTENDWKFSETYCYSTQSKSIISDKHTRKYLSLSSDDRILSQLQVWG